jgi:hypothetical protein
MATRGSLMSRVVRYFKEEDLDVAIITLQHIRNIVDARSRKEGAVAPKPAGAKRGRKPKSTAAKNVAAVVVDDAPYSEEGESLANA